MSYPGGYPPYPQGPGQQQPVPPPYQATTPLSYPVYPGSAAPYPSGGYNPYPPPQPGMYPGQNPSPYPSQPSSSPYPQIPSSTPYPAAPASSAPYPGAPASSPYPSSSPYPTQGGYPSQYPPQPGYPGGGASQSPYPSIPTAYPSQGGYPPPGSGAGYPGGYQTGAAPATTASTPVSQYTTYKGEPTLRPAQPFDPRVDAEILRKAMKGFGTDEKALIQVLTKRTNNQRQEIALQFKTLYGKDLIADIKSEVSGKFEDLLVALLTPIPTFLAKEIHHAISGIGTNEETLVEILCTATNSDIRYIKHAYTSTFGTSMEEDLSSDTSGNFRRLLVSLCQGNRSENFMVNPDEARADAQALLRAGELRLGTDESTFNAILCSRSYPQLAAAFHEYRNLTGNDFESAIKSEFSGDVEQGLLAIVRSVRDKASFFAEQLYKSMSGAGTRDRALIRVVSTRCEIDMATIKQAYSSKYGKSLEEAIADDTSGDYKKALLSLIS